ncbi:hypothetical protein RFI_32746, partial [Reticulomyxa filosa]
MEPLVFVSVIIICSIHSEALALMSVRLLVDNVNALEGKERHVHVFVSKMYILLCKKISVHDLTIFSKRHDNINLFFFLILEILKFPTCLSYAKNFDKIMSSKNIIKIYFRNYCICFVLKYQRMYLQKGSKISSLFPLLYSSLDSPYPIQINQSLRRVQEHDIQKQKLVCICQSLNLFDMII